METLTFANSEKGIMVTGKTFGVKEILKAHGGSWDPAAAAWIFRGQSDMEAVRSLVVAEVEVTAAATKATAAAARKATREANKVQRDWLKTPEGRAASAAAEKARVTAARNAGARWICCDNSTVIDWARKTTSCSACYPDGHIRVRGCCYTGD